MNRTLPSPRQASILRYVAICILKGQPPSVREVCEEFDIRSPNGVATNINPLVVKKRLLKSEKKSRGLRIPGQECYFPLGTITQGSTLTDGQVAAGRRDLTEEVLAAALPLVDGTEITTAIYVADGSLEEFGIKQSYLIVLGPADAVQVGDDILCMERAGKITRETFAVGTPNVLGAIRCMIQLRLRTGG